MKAPRPKSHDPIPAGNHVARLYRIIHVGTVPDTFNGEPKQTNQIHLTFELCNETKVFKEGEAARPLSISTRFLTYSMGKKSNLRKLVEGFGGVSLHEEEAYNFDHEQLIGMPCLLNVVQDERNGNVYSNIHSASPLPKGMVAPDMANQPQIVDIDTSSEEEIAALPDFLKNKMYESEEWAGRQKHKENMVAHGYKNPVQKPKPQEEEEPDEEEII